MAAKLKHPQSNSRTVAKAAGHEAIFLGPRDDDQKGRAQVCSRCHQPIALVYHVYERNPKTGAVVRGQYEVAHLDDEGDVLRWDCAVPGLLQEYRVKAAEALASDEGRRAARRNTGIVHWEQGDRVACGATGSLQVTDIDTEVTCGNCEKRMKLDRVSSTVLDRPTSTVIQSTSDLVNQTKGDHMNTTQTPAAPKTDVKAKIAAAKAKAAANKAGSSANLQPPAPATPAPATPADPPMPKETKTGKKVKQVGPAATPKAKKEVSYQLCGCGCEASCKSRFIPGHDAKLHGWLKRLSDGRMALAELPAQVLAGMFKGVKQSSQKVGDQVTLGGVLPKVDEATYLATLTGTGTAPDA